MNLYGFPPDELNRAVNYRRYVESVKDGAGAIAVGFTVGRCLDNLNRCLSLGMFQTAAYWLGRIHFRLSQGEVL